MNLVPGRSLIRQLSGPGGHTAALVALGNVLLFAATSLVTRLALGWSAKRTIALGVLMSISIEFLQFALHLGRISDIDDVILNGLGVALGCFAGQGRLRRLVARRVQP